MIHRPGSALVERRPGDKAEVIQPWWKNSDESDSVQRLTQTLKRRTASNKKLILWSLSDSYIFSFQFGKSEREMMNSGTLKS